MKNLSRLIALLLCFVLCALVFASCGKDEEEETPVTTAASETVGIGASDATTLEETTVEATTDKWEVLAPKVVLISPKDRALRIECSNHTTAEKTSKNDIYLKGPDEVVDGETPLIQIMVYERNKAANDLLQTTTEYTFWDGGMGSLAEKIDVTVKGNAQDMPDLFVNMVYELNRALLFSDFKDIFSIPNTFFEFDTDGWLYEWMRNLSFTNDRGYILGGDYFLDIFRAIPVLPFNMTMMDKNAAKLASAIIGPDDTLGQGEDLSTRFFDLVELGDWTWDVLGKLCEGIWIDTDAGGTDSIYDQLGLIADEFGDGGQCACSYIFSCGEELCEAYTVEDASSKYYNQQWIKYADDSTGLNHIFDAVKTVIEGPGTISTNYTLAGSTPEQPGIAYHQIKFAAGETLFAGAQLLGALEDEVFQNMVDLYSVVPFPKTDSTKSYNTIVYSTGDVGAINVKSGPRRVRVLTAYLQYCTENSPAIREEFLQIVTKYKTTVYNQGTDRMLDLIYKSILWGRDKIVDDLAGTSGNRWHSLMRNQHFVGGSDFISAQYESVRSLKQNRLDNYMEKWYNLPKSEPAN